MSDDWGKSPPRARRRGRGREGRGRPRSPGAGRLAGGRAGYRPLPKPLARRRRAGGERRVSERLADSRLDVAAARLRRRAEGVAADGLRRLRIRGRGRPVPDHAEAERYAARHSRDPLARLFPGLPRGVRVTLDWILTIAGAILIVLALKEWVVNPYRIPSSSMEPTLNCAKGPANPGCLGDSSDRVLACRICLDFGSPSRGDIVVFNTPKGVAGKCGEGGTFVKRVIGLPGDTVHEDNKGFISIKKPNTPEFVKLKESYIPPRADLRIISISDRPGRSPRARTS